MRFFLYRSTMKLVIASSRMAPKNGFSGRLPRVARCSCPPPHQGQSEFPAFRQREAVSASLGADLLDEVLALRAGNAVARFSDNPVNALSVDHDVDGKAEIAIAEAFGRDAVFGDPLAGFQAADGRPIKVHEAQSHGASYSAMLSGSRRGCLSLFLPGFCRFCSLGLSCSERFIA
jgi:hypothetical protein